MCIYMHAYLRQLVWLHLWVQPSLGLSHLGLTRSERGGSPVRALRVTGQGLTQYDSRSFCGWHLESIG